MNHLIFQTIRSATNNEQYTKASRKVLPYWVWTVGLYKPLTEPCLPVSGCTAPAITWLHLTFWMMYFNLTSPANHCGFSPFGYHCSFPNVLTFKIFQFVNVMNFIMLCFLWVQFELLQCYRFQIAVFNRFSMLFIVVHFHNARLLILSVGFLAFLHSEYFAK